MSDFFLADLPRKQRLSRVVLGYQENSDFPKSLTEPSSGCAIPRTGGPDDLNELTAAMAPTAANPTAAAPTVATKAVRPNPPLLGATAAAVPEILIKTSCLPHSALRLLRKTHF